MYFFMPILAVRRFSNDWKNGVKSFQRLEKPREIFPMIGKSRRKVSNDWKTPLFRLPTIGKLALASFLLPIGLPKAMGGEALMAQVRAALPTIPLQLSGELQSRDRRGNIVRVTPVEMELDWGAAIPQARYMVLDRFGRTQEKLHVMWPDRATPEFAWWSGDPLTEQPLEDLDQSIAGLDLTWADLSWSFLWWDGAERIGSERVRGRYCEIVELPAPTDQGYPFEAVRLWIDPAVGLFMRADTVDRRGRTLRRIEVRSLQRIDDLWMIQNLDLLNQRTRERVTLRIRELEAVREP